MATFIVHARVCACHTYQHAIEENYRKNFAGGDEENTSIGSGLIHVEKIVEEGNKIVDAVAHGDVAQLASQTLGVAASVVVRVVFCSRSWYMYTRTV